MIAVTVLLSLRHVSLSHPLTCPHLLLSICWAGVLHPCHASFSRKSLLSMPFSGICRLPWKVGKEQERLCRLMLMLLNSRSVMKGSLRDLIEVSVGQTRGGFIQPGILFTSHSQSWHREDGRRLFLGSGPQADKQGGGVSEISFKMRVQSRVWTGDNSRGPAITL